MTDWDSVSRGCQALVVPEFDSTTESVRRVHPLVHASRRCGSRLGAITQVAVRKVLAILNQKGAVSQRHDRFLGYPGAL